jgi:hypothetical protein
VFQAAPARQFYFAELDAGNIGLGNLAAQVADTSRQHLLAQTQRHATGTNNLT